MGTVLENQVITSEAGRITKIEPGSPSEGHPTVNCISAGFIDVHVNGGERFHFTDKADQEALGYIGQAFEKVERLTPYQHLLPLRLKLFSKVWIR
ncbi:hypothetical protein [Desertivirga xinjiangensis]|uniref:hypothetical protein n=1 Tax=Desertivirga xinjiangensis TaxID=539206 RepID=UPI00210EC3B8|nr:hypothetical protein [Pedobacter xinjiangensis]